MTESQMPATIELFDGTVTLTGWSLTELSPDFYGHSHMQIGGWLPEDYQPDLIAQGTNLMVRADLPGIPDVAQAVNVQVETKSYGGPQRFMKIQWRHLSYPTNWLDTLRDTGKLPAPIADGRTPRWLADRQTRLGQMIGCTATGCSFAEWSSKAEERGWVRRGDSWLCVQCADAADERAEIVARIDAGTWGGAALSYRAQQLLAHVRETVGTRWTTGRAERLYAELGYPKRGRRHDARSDLHALAALDLVTVHGPDDGRYFLLAQPKDGA
ncbi:hypothetical protein [Streptomyces sp. AM 2-1-1]|uniref:hypothetical protein n=1 Tax=Streptomyces sp. AM 2-1-1 TaxID=3028709 RepID=UPI0023B924AA|nr:hypothetical protein [Streptomyces sp. AM 2-1-1]WEH40754.1 hypothetical protein PZB77_15280 [Streptomyces sp. AM 2-1-1]